MKLLSIRKDGGAESKCNGYFLIEIKKLFTIVLLHFSDGSRDAYHSHAFNAISWILHGRLEEDILDKPYSSINVYKSSLTPIITLRSTFHKVVSVGDTWAISFRGPWADSWKEWIPAYKKFITLTHGRKVVNETHS